MPDPNAYAGKVVGARVSDPDLVVADAFYVGGVRSGTDVQLRFVITVVDGIANRPDPTARERRSISFSLRPEQAREMARVLLDAAERGDDDPAWMDLGG